MVGRSSPGVLIRLATPARVRREEWIDSHDHSAADFYASFRDIARINRFLGGTSVVRRHLGDLPASSLSILDVGTGLGDIPCSLVRWGRKRGVEVHCVGLDNNAKLIGLAERESHGLVRFLRGDIAHLPFRDESFDVVVSSLTFHHFDESFAAEALREMHRVSRRAVIVNDLRRGYLPAMLIWLVTRITGMHRLTCHDAPLSVMRAFTPSEFRALATQAGLDPEVFCHPFWRAAIVVTKP